MAWHYAQVVETSAGNEDAYGNEIDADVLASALRRELTMNTCMNEGIGGGVKRFREFVIFHGERVYPEYLLAYRRGSKLGSTPE